MTHEGHVKWELNNHSFIEVYFQYFLQYGTLYVTEIAHNGQGVSDEELKEAVMNELGPCQFDDTEIVTI